MIKFFHTELKYFIFTIIYWSNKHIVFHKFNITLAFAYTQIKVITNLNNDSEK